MTKFLIICSLTGLSLGLGWGWLERPVVGNRPVQPSKGKEIRSGDASPSGLPVPLKGPGGRQLAMLDRIATASREDLVRLTQEVLSGKKELLHLTSLIWERWLEVDAEGGLQALLAGEFGGENRMPNVWEYLGKWSVKDPETALVRAMALPEKRDTDAAMSRITMALAARRPGLTH